MEILCYMDVCDSFPPGHVALATFKWGHLCVCHTSCLKWGYFCVWHTSYHHSFSPKNGLGSGLHCFIAVGPYLKFHFSHVPLLHWKMGYLLMSRFCLHHLLLTGTGSKSHLGSWASLSKMAQRVPLLSSKVLTSLSGMLHRRKGSLGSEHIRQQDLPVTGAHRGLA